MGVEGNVEELRGVWSRALNVVLRRVLILLIEVLNKVIIVLCMLLYCVC